MSDIRRLPTGRRDNSGAGGEHLDGIGQAVAGFGDGIEAQSAGRAARARATILPPMKSPGVGRDRERNGADGILSHFWVLPTLFDLFWALNKREAPITCGCGYVNFDLKLRGGPPAPAGRPGRVFSALAKRHFIRRLGRKWITQNHWKADAMIAITMTETARVELLKVLKQVSAKSVRLINLGFG
jgi:hypothetical protein